MKEGNHSASDQRTTRVLAVNGDTFRKLGGNLKLLIIDAWLDLTVLIILGVAAAGVWVAPHAFNRLFPVLFFEGSGDIVWTQFAYPYIKPPLNSAAVGLICGLIPLFTILIAQFWLHSFDDASHAILGLLYALSTGTLFQVTLKKTIGGLRPHFLAVCEPEVPQNAATMGSGYQSIMFTVEQVCRGDMKRIGNAIESFPSGHSQIAWAGLGYLAIYLFTHLRIQHQLRPSLWKMCLILAPLLLATYVASSLVLSYNHHGYDVLAGGLIGVFVALFSYRMVFMGIWDRRWNIVPRVRCGSDTEPLEGSNESVDTHQAVQHEVPQGNPRPKSILPQ